MTQGCNTLKNPSRSVLMTSSQSSPSAAETRCRGARRRCDDRVVGAVRRDVSRESRTTPRAVPDIEADQPARAAAGANSCRRMLCPGFVAA